MAFFSSQQMLALRDRLNELPFQNGKRQVLIGRISDQLGSEPEGDSGEDEQAAAQRAAAIEQYLGLVRGELSAHDLQLSRSVDDPDKLFAVQPLRDGSKVDLSWMGAAMAWAARITAIGLEMMLPVAGGMWLDARLGTSFLGIVGILIGLPLGLWHVMLVSRGRQTAAGDNERLGPGSA